MEIFKEFYGEEYYSHIVNVCSDVTNTIKEFDNNERKIIEHISNRIKNPDSVQKKLKKKNLIWTKTSIKQDLLKQNALKQDIKDIIGIRIVCKFLNDVYDLVNYIKSIENYTIFKEKDYIKNPKTNGYRSYHVIIQVATEQGDFFVEIQIRTISQDAWASLEHQMKYKKHINHEKLIVSELKRCADELASTDISMQTIWELIEGNQLD